MRRSILAALAAALILTTASPALADDGWSPYKGHWVHWQTTSAAVLQPESSAWLHYQSEVAHAIVKAEKANDRYRAAIRAAKAAAAVRTAPRPSQGASYGSGSCASGYVHDLIVADFAASQLGTAFYVANRESHCSPSAQNPSSSAAGVYQIVSGTWTYWSATCGYGGASVFSASANVAVAACMVRNGGWGPWGM